MTLSRRLIALIGLGLATGCRSGAPPRPEPAAPAPETRPVPAPADSTVAAMPADTIQAVALDSTRLPEPTPSDSAVRTPAPAARRCQFVIERVDREGVYVTVMEGVVNYFAGGNVRFRCANIPVRIASDSVASYQGQVVQFVGAVRYRDSTVDMQSDFGTYFKGIEKWEARGNVVLRNLVDGSTLKGPSLDYFLEVPGVPARSTTELYADQRPTVTLPVRDSLQAEAAPYIVVGDRVRARGEDKMWAAGRVTIDREDFAGRGDSLQMDLGEGNAGALIGSALMRRIATDSFRLRGARIDLTLANRELTYVTARDSADLVGTDLSLVGDTIGLDIANREVEQTLAWGRTVRPLALSNSYEIRGDSLAFDTPARELKEIRAFVNAWVGAQPDSAGDRDWVSGDKVIASFVSRDSAGTRRPALERLQATGGARSLYRLRQSAQDRASVSYTIADTIVVTMRVTPDSVAVERVFAVGSVEGVHLQPAVARPDSARADSLRTPTDTGAVRRRR